MHSLTLSLAAAAAFLFTLGPFASEPVEISPPESVASSPSEPIEMSPSADIRYGRTCGECQTMLEHGLRCTIVAKKSCGSGDFEKGSGMCVAKAGDAAAYCSGRCSRDSDCPGSMSCGQIGSQRVCVK